MIFESALLIVGVCFLAYSNGSNDNFKGAATLFGSGTTNYETALFWATATTFAGSLCSVFLAETLVANFSGKGLVPDAIVESPGFLRSVVIGAGLCVWLATVTGLPISTTHALTGALVGAGFMAAGREVNIARLGGAYFLPLLLSPLAALILSGGLYGLFRRLRKSTGIEEESCICLGENGESLGATGPEIALPRAAMIDLSVGKSTECAQRYPWSFFGLEAQRVLDSAHYLSAGVVSFARGLNDTPKIVAALVAAQAAGLHNGLLLVTLFMAAGGLLQARKVAETMGKKITPLNHGQGFAANLVTGFLVVFASRMGFPVSTTHVSVGSLFGIGTITGTVDRRAMSGIVAAWVGTLPLAAMAAAVVYRLLQVT